MLDVERQYFADHLADLLQNYRGRFVVVKEQELVGAFDTPEAALRGAALRFGLAPVLVRRVQESQPDLSIPALTLGLLHADPPRAVQRNRDEPARPASPARS